MFRLIALALGFFAGSCYGGSQRIIGGSPARIQDYPSLVQVDFYNTFTFTWSQNCAGNILNEIYILSAAHCFEGRSYYAAHRRVRAGSTYRNQGGYLSRVHYAHNHPSYAMASRWDGDISVVRLVDPLFFGPTVAQGRIVYQNTVIPDSMGAIQAGWGHTSQGGNSSPILLDTIVYVINNDLCRDRYLRIPNNIVTRNMICAGLLDVGGRDSCQGDAGGPLYVMGTVVGVVSWGVGCGNATFPSVNTAVSSYSNWIRDTTV